MMSDPGGCHRRTAQTLLRTAKPSIVAVRLRCGNRRVVQPVLPTGVRTTLAYPGIHVGLAAIGMLVGAVGLPGAFWPLAGLLLVPLGARRVIARLEGGARDAPRPNVAAGAVGDTAHQANRRAPATQRMTTAVDAIMGHAIGSPSNMAARNRPMKG